jgi:proliferating cell nuclear antigen PCNA
MEILHPVVSQNVRAQLASSTAYPGLSYSSPLFSVVIVTRHIIFIIIMPAAEQGFAFTATFKNAKLIKNAIEIMAVWNEETVVALSEKGISIQTMDKCKCAHMQIEFTREIFHAHSFSCPKPFKVAVRLKVMSRVLGCAKNDDNITWQIQDVDADVSTFSFRSTKRVRHSQFDMNLMTMIDSGDKMPPCSFPAQFTMPAIEYENVIKELKAISTKMAIVISPKQARFVVSGDMIRTGAISFDARFDDEHKKADNEDDSGGEDDGNKVESGDQSSRVTILYNQKQAGARALIFHISMELLTITAKTSSVSQEVTVAHWGGKMPLMMEFKVGDSSLIRYFFAPSDDLTSDESLMLTEEERGSESNKRQCMDEAYDDDGEDEEDDD